MKAEPTQNLRVIIQFIRGEVPKYSRYRLIAYGSENLGPAESLSFEELAGRFAVAGIAPEHRPTPPQCDLDHTTIVFTADLALTAKQLHILGLGR